MRKEAGDQGREKGRKRQIRCDRELIIRTSEVSRMKLQTIKIHQSFQNERRPHAVSSAAALRSGRTVGLV